MSVTAIREYVGVPRDVVANYHGNQLVYVCWDQHLAFAAPFICMVDPAMKFGDFLSQQLAAIIANHPDTPKIDWRQTEWEKADQPWTPDFDQSFAANGLVHKDYLRFRTPGLNGWRGLGI